MKNGGSFHSYVNVCQAGYVPCNWEHYHLVNRIIPCWTTCRVISPDLPGLVNVDKKRWNDPPFFMGKSTISMAISNSYVKLPEGTIWMVNFLISAENFSEFF